MWVRAQESKSQASAFAIQGLTGLERQVQERPKRGSLRRETSGGLGRDDVHIRQRAAFRSSMVQAEAEDSGPL